MTASKIFLYFCLSFVLGIFLNSFFNFSLPVLLAVLILGIILISALWQYKKLVVIGFSILFLVLGIWRHESFESRIMNNELEKFNDLNQDITLVGIVSTEPDIKEKSQKMIIKSEQLTPKESLHDPTGQRVNNRNINISGKVLVITGRYPEYKYGDKLKITGKLETPLANINGFNYKDYLKKDGIYSVISFPKIELVEKNQENFIYVKILQLKNKLRESIYQNLSPPQSSLLEAIILGEKRQIPDDLKNKLNIAGLRHITAVSGLHVTVLTTILMTLLIGLGFWRQQAFYFAIILITLFIVMTGFQVSTIRAGIMASLFLISQYLGRMSASSRAIVFAATVMLFQNPLLLRLDVGFQLSFLAMLGIIYLLPIFRNWLKFIPWKNPKSILAMTFSAYLFTLPILVYNFGYISLVAPITNLLIVPLLYWIMLFGFLFALVGIIFQPLGWVLSLPTWFLLSYVIKIIDISSKLPYAFKTLEISWIWLIISYFILGLVTWRLQERQKLKFLNY